MPISKDEWDRGKTGESPSTTEEQVLEFLRRNSGRAFTYLEVYEAVEGKLLVRDARSIVVSVFGCFEFWGAIEGLVKGGRDEKRRIRKGRRTETYYKAL